jgi:hypothetical protein
MAVPTSYSELQTEIARILNRDDVDDTCTSAIGYAENMFNRTLFVPEREEVSTTTTADSTLAVPTDFWGVKSLAISADPLVVLEPLDYSLLRTTYPSSTATAQPRHYSTRAGSEIILGPTSDASYTYLLAYWQTIPALSSAITSNWLLVAYPDLYVWSGVMFAYQELRDPEGYAATAGAVGDMLQQIVKAGNRKAFFPTRRRTMLPGDMFNAPTFNINTG